MLECEGENRDMSTIGGFGSTPTPIKEEDEGEFMGKKRTKSRAKME